MFSSSKFLKILGVLLTVITTQGVASQQNFWANWNDLEMCQIETFFAPSTQDTLVSLVQKAYQLEKKIKVLGAGHSLNAIALPEQREWTISLENYAKILAVDPENQTITVQGGATLKQINEALAQHGLSLENLPTISDQTISGAVQTGTHGTGRNYGPMHTQIVAMTIINGKAELKTLTPTTSPRLFRAYQCGLGTLGIIDTVTLRTVPARLLREWTYATQWPDLLNQLETLVQRNDHCRLFWFPYTQHAGVWTANSESGDVLKFSSPLFSQFNRDPVPVSQLIEEVAIERKNPMIESIEDVLELGPSDPAILKRVNRAFFEADYGMPYERVARSDCILNADCGTHGHCCAAEVAFPIQHAKTFLLELQKLIEENCFPAHTGVEVRFAKADPALLSLTYSEQPEDLFCFVSIVSIRPNGHSIPYQPFFQAFQQLAEKYQGRPHWGKMGEFDPSYLKRVYPCWEQFLELRKQEDPSGIFLNAWGKRIFGNPSQR